MELKEKETDSDEISAELDTLLYKASHDIKAPLATIKGLLNLVKYETYLPNIFKSLEIIEECTTNLEKIFKNLEKASVIRNEAPLYEVIDFDLLMLKIKEDLNFGGKNIRIDYTNDFSEIFNSDRDYIRTIIKNLLENAVQFSKEEVETTVEVSIIKTDEHLAIAVADNGLGIEDESRKKIFDMFYRGSEKSKGPGLGLYIVKKMVDKLKGEIILERDNGAVTRFRIILPLLSSVF